MAISSWPDDWMQVDDASTWGSGLHFWDLDAPNIEREEGDPGYWGYSPMSLIDSDDYYYDSPGPHSSCTSQSSSFSTSDDESDDESMAGSVLGDSPLIKKSTGRHSFGHRMATPPTDMAAHDTVRAPVPNPHAGKRKFLNDSDAGPKKRRATQSDTQARRRTPTSPPSAPTSNYAQLHDQLLAKLDRKYAVKPMSVMPSTSISKHVDAALTHLGRFDAWDLSVLPGVVLLSAKSAAAGKLVTISEVVRRRISESKQKWFQYNLLKEVAVHDAPQQEPSVVEDTYMAEADEGEDADDDDEYFETRRPTIHEQAVQPAKVRHTTYLSVLLSRVPLDELATEPSILVQTNEPFIQDLRKRMGLVG